MSIEMGRQNFIMLTDGEKTSDEFIFEVNSLESFLMETDVSKTPEQSSITAWFRYNDVNEEIYNGQRGKPLYNRLFEQVKTQDFIGAEYIGETEIRLHVNIDYIQALTVKRNPNTTDGKMAHEGQVRAQMQYRESIHPNILYEGDMRACFCLFHELARQVKKLSEERTDITFVELHGAPNEKESILDKIQ